MIAWLALIGAGLLETVYAVALDKSRTFTKLVPTVVFLVVMPLSMIGLAYSIRTLPVGTAYAVWVGIGAVGTAGYGMLVLDEPATFGRIFCLLLIIAGVIGLKLLH